MRSAASILHLDLDAFFAAVEQRDKPSLRGKPVIVGGRGARAVVSTASYEARVFGVGSAMPAGEARRRCPHGAFLAGRYAVYRQVSKQVMALLHELSPTVEQLSIDEAYVDVAHLASDSTSLLALAQTLRADVERVTDGLTASVGLGSSKFMAKVASELAKPNGARLIEPGTEADVIAPLPVRAIPGVGPVTAEKLTRMGWHTVADLQQADVAELLRELGELHGRNLYALAHARDDRPVEPGRETKSISVEHTFEADVRERTELADILRRDAAHVAGRVTASGLFAKTIQLKVRMGDFTTLTRARTLAGATDDPTRFAQVALDLLAGVDIREGVRLIGIGASNFTEQAQEMLFDVESDADVVTAHSTSTSNPPNDSPRIPEFVAGMDVTHDDFGDGWVWGSGLGRVTVRFETRHTPPGPVRTFLVTDPQLRAKDVTEEPLAN